MTEGIKSGEYGGCCKVILPNKAIIFLVLILVCGRALSCGPHSSDSFTKPHQAFNVCSRVHYFFSWSEINQNDTLNIPKDSHYDVSSRIFYIFGLVGRVFANGPGDLGSIPGRVIPKTFKMALHTSLLISQQYKVRIEGKGEQTSERSWCCTYLKGSLLVTLDNGRQLTTPYSPDLVPSEYHPFGPINECLRCKHYASNMEVKTAMMMWLKEHSTQF